MIYVATEKRCRFILADDKCWLRKTSAILRYLSDDAQWLSNYDYDCFIQRDMSSVTVK